MYNLLLREIPGLTVDERLMVIAGCAHVAKLLEAERDAQSVHEAIYQRVRRARQSFQRDAAKYGWNEADSDFSSLLRDSWLKKAPG